MALLQFQKVKISGICACVPSRVVDNETFSKVHSEKETRKLIRSTGIKQRRFADFDVCASDLSVQAGEKLLRDLTIDRSSIDILIFLSQTPDYLGIPPSSMLL